MRKISEIVRKQASCEFKQKKQEVIRKTLEKRCINKKSFQECLKMYGIA